MYVTSFHIFLFIGIAQGLFLAVMLQSLKQKNKAANIILSILLILACIMLTGKTLIFDTKELTSMRYGSLIDTPIFLFGPIGYLYLKKLLSNHKSFTKLEMGAYAFPLAHLVFSSWLVFMPESSLIELYSSKNIYITYFFIEIIALLFNFYFWYLCRSFINVYQKAEKKHLSSTQTVSTFAKVLLYVILTFLLLWLCAMLSPILFKVAIPIVNYNTVWIAIPIVIYLLGFYAFRQPEIFRLPITKSSKERSRTYRLPQEEVKRLTTELEGLMSNDKVFLIHQLTLSELAEQLNTSTNNLSWLLNNVYQMTFYDYINKLRINEFLRKIENKEHKIQTLLSLSMDAGFSSKSTFNKAFKAVMKDTPSAYIRKLSM